MNCEYCKTKVREDDMRCPACGAPNQKTVRSVESIKNFFYFHGFMVYCEWDSSGNQNWYVFEGDKLVGNFQIERRFMMEYESMFGEGISIEPLAYKLLRLAIGETEVERIEAQNQLCPYTFIIRQEKSYEFEEAHKTIESWNLRV
jgi:hypothetical protein